MVGAVQAVGGAAVVKPVILQLQPVACVVALDVVAVVQVADERLSY